MNRDMVILIGAGASYGANHVLPERPPLGADLYGALAMRYPDQWGTESHLGIWAPKLRDDFERTMYDDVLPKVDSLSLLEWHRSIAKFFARYRLDATRRDMYSLFLSRLNDTGILGRVTFGSLNYDCLLEQAMLELGLTADYLLDNFGPPDSIPVAKIHGSRSFITDDLFSDRSQLTAPGYSLECGVAALPLPNLENRLLERFSTYQPAYFPVLSTCSPHKPSIVAPARLQKVRNALAEQTRGAKALVLIGIKPNPQLDPHLWEPVAQSPASKILYVGCDADFKVLLTLQGKAVHVAEKFEDGLEPILKRIA